MPDDRETLRAGIAMEPDAHSQPPFSRTVTLALWIVPLVFGLWRYFDPDRLFGDLTDTRFNVYILEHGYQWLIGKAASFWDAPMFWPATHNTVAFSDNQIGNLPLYALMRQFTADPLRATWAWLLLVSVLNFAATLWVVQRWTGHAAGSSMAAFLFTFGMPVIAQTQHVQLVPRYCIPLAFWLLWQAWQTLQFRFVAGLLAVIVLQFYTLVYDAVFLLEMLAAFLVAALLWPATRAQTLALLWPRTVRPWLLRVLAAGLAAVVLVPMLLPHMRAFGEHGKRTWGVVISMTLTPFSLLLPPDHSLLWQPLEGFTRWQGTTPEHRVFIGATVPLVTLGWWLLRRRKSSEPPEKLLVLMGLTALLCVAMTARLTMKHSLYWFIYVLPGLGSLRAIARIVLVLLFPLGVLLAFEVRDLWRWTPVKWRNLLLLLPILLMLDQGMRDYTWFSIDAANRRTATLVQQVRAQKPDAEAVAVLGRNGVTAATDAMAVSQALDMAAVNGYSGNFPKGWAFFTDQQGLDAWLTRCGADLTLPTVRRDRIAVVTMPE